MANAPEPLFDQLKHWSEGGEIDKDTDLHSFLRELHDAIEDIRKARKVTGKAARDNRDAKRAYRLAQKDHATMLRYAEAQRRSGEDTAVREAEALASYAEQESIEAWTELQNKRTDEEIKWKKLFR